MVGRWRRSTNYCPGEIDEFVPKKSIDPRLLIRPYYLVPDGKVGHDAFAVIRETIRNMDMVAIGQAALLLRCLCWHERDQRRKYPGTNKVNRSSGASGELV
jgi:hypothetical protein